MPYSPSKRKASPKPSSPKLSLRSFLVYSLFLVGTQQSSYHFASYKALNQPGVVQFENETQALRARIWSALDQLERGVVEPEDMQEILCRLREDLKAAETEDVSDLRENFAGVLFEYDIDSAAK